MHISWLGDTCIRLQTKYQNEDIVTVIDPYRPAQGDFPRSLSPQIALFSQGQENSVTLSQNPFVLDTLGECETKEVMMSAFPTPSGNIIFKVLAEQLFLVHLGKLGKKPEIAELEKLGAIDILFVPVGGGDYLSPEDAASITTALEPRIIIPIAYQSDSNPKLKPVSEFIKESGLKPDTTDKKIILKKKDLPQGETKLIILEKNV